MNSHYRFELMKKQLEGEREEVQIYEERLGRAFADVSWLHDSIARGRIDETDVADMPRALHLFRAYARDLLRCYETTVAPCLRAVGRPLPDYLDDRNPQRN